MKPKLDALILLAGLAGAGILAACDDGTGPVDPIVPLTSEAKATLDDALQDAYRSYYTYDAVLDDIGPVAPFSTLAAAELAYTNDLVALYVSHDATPPASIWNSGNVPHFADMQQACMAAEEGEVATTMMMERLLQRTLPNDVRQALEAKRVTARNTHRMQFRNCAGGTIAPVTQAVTASMAEAIEDEYRAFYTYSRVMADLGNVAPFVNIRDAESMHMGALGNLYVKRDATVPSSTWTLDNVERFTTLQAACAAAVDGEIENVMMYDRLLQQDLPADVERVFENLRAASLKSHLPAFQQCAGSGTAPVASDVADAMEEAIQDEYRAYFTYSAVVEDLEPDFPFSMIRNAEESHYTAIADLYTRRGLAVPASEWTLANVPRFATLVAACAAGVQGEVDNIAMYDRLLVLTLPEDVKRVFENLRAASADRHLPAFQACD